MADRYNGIELPEDLPDYQEDTSSADTYRDSLADKYTREYKHQPLTTDVLHRAIYGEGK